MSSRKRGFFDNNDPEITSQRRRLEEEEERQRAIYQNQNQHHYGLNGFPQNAQEQPNGQHQLHPPNGTIQQQQGHNQGQHPPNQWNAGSYPQHPYQPTPVYPPVFRHASQMAPVSLMGRATRSAASSGAANMALLGQAYAHMEVASPRAQPYGQPWNNTHANGYLGGPVFGGSNSNNNPSPPVFIPNGVNRLPLGGRPQRAATATNNENEVSSTSNHLDRAQAATTSNPNQGDPVQNNSIQTSQNQNNQRASRNNNPAANNNNPVVANEDESSSDDEDEGERSAESDSDSSSDSNSNSNASQVNVPANGARNGPNESSDDFQSVVSEANDIEDGLNNEDREDDDEDEESVEGEDEQDDETIVFRQPANAVDTFSIPLKSLEMLVRLDDFLGRANSFNYHQTDELVEGVFTEKLDCQFITHHPAFWPKLLGAALTEVTSPENVSSVFTWLHYSVDNVRANQEALPTPGPREGADNVRAVQEAVLMPPPRDLADLLIQLVNYEQAFTVAATGALPEETFPQPPGQRRRLQRRHLGPSPLPYARPEFEYEASRRNNPLISVSVRYTGVATNETRNLLENYIFRRADGSRRLVIARMNSKKKHYYKRNISYIVAMVVSLYDESDEGGRKGALKKMLRFANNVRADGRTPYIEPTRPAYNGRGRGSANQSEDSSPAITTLLSFLHSTVEKAAILMLGGFFEAVRIRRGATYVPSAASRQGRSVGGDEDADGQLLASHGNRRPAVGAINRRTPSGALNNPLTAELMADEQAAIGGCIALLAIAKALPDEPEEEVGRRMFIPREGPFTGYLSSLACQPAAWGIFPLGTPLKSFSRQEIECLTLSIISQATLAEADDEVIENGDESNNAERPAERHPRPVEPIFTIYPEPPTARYVSYGYWVLGSLDVDLQSYQLTSNGASYRTPPLPSPSCSSSARRAPSPLEALQFTYTEVLVLTPGPMMVGYAPCLSHQRPQWLLQSEKSSLFNTCNGVLVQDNALHQTNFTLPEKSKVKKFDDSRALVVSVVRSLTKPKEVTFFVNGVQVVADKKSSETAAKKMKALEKAERAAKAPLAVVNPELFFTMSPGVYQQALLLRDPEHWQYASSCKAALKKKKINREREIHFGELPVSANLLSLEAQMRAEVLGSGSSGGGSSGNTDAEDGFQSRRRRFAETSLTRPQSQEPTLGEGPSTLGLSSLEARVEVSEITSTPNSLSVSSGTSGSPTQTAVSSSTVERPSAYSSDLRDNPDVSTFSSATSTPPITGEPLSSVLDIRNLSAEEGHQDLASSWSPPENADLADPAVAGFSSSSTASLEIGPPAGSNSLLNSPFASSELPSSNLNIPSPFSLSTTPSSPVAYSISLLTITSFSSSLAASSLTTHSLSSLTTSAAASFTPELPSFSTSQSAQVAATSSNSNSNSDLNSNLISRPVQRAATPELIVLDSDNEEEVDENDDNEDIIDDDDDDVIYLSSTSQGNSRSAFVSHLSSASSLPSTSSFVSGNPVNNTSGLPGSSVRGPGEGHSTFVGPNKNGDNNNNDNNRIDDEENDDHEMNNDDHEMNNEDEPEQADFEMQNNDLQDNLPNNFQQDYENVFHNEFDFQHDFGLGGPFQEEEFVNEIHNELQNNFPGVFPIEPQDDLDGLDDEDPEDDNLQNAHQNNFHQLSDEQIDIQYGLRESFANAFPNSRQAELQISQPSESKNDLLLSINQLDLSCHLGVNNFDLQGDSQQNDLVEMPQNESEKNKIIARNEKEEESEEMDIDNMSATELDNFEDNAHFRTDSEFFDYV